VAVLVPAIIGSHAVIYTEAARAWIAGGDPWQVGPPAVVFAGPPPMLLPFLPFVALPGLAVRATWVVGSFVVAVWSLRRFGLPAYWIGFPPLVEAIVLGHPEVLLLGLLALRGPLSGLAVIVKPYAGLPLLAERRWGALALAAIALVVTIPVLPWPRFMAELPAIASTLVRQSAGDSTFGQPLLMIIGAVALASLGLRRALWLSVPVLWPYAQPIYKVVTVPALSPLLALAWSIPIPGSTLAGLILEATLLLLLRHDRLPRQLKPILQFEPRRQAAWPVPSS